MFLKKIPSIQNSISWLFIEVGFGSYLLLVFMFLQLIEKLEGIFTRLQKNVNP